MPVRLIFLLFCILPLYSHAITIEIQSSDSTTSTTNHIHAVDSKKYRVTTTQHGSKLKGVQYEYLKPSDAPLNGMTGSIAFEVDDDYFQFNLPDKFKTNLHNLLSGLIPFGKTYQSHLDEQIYSCMTVFYYLVSGEIYSEDHKRALMY